MGKFKIFIILFTSLLSQQLIAQVDTVSFRFVRDASTFKIRCHAQKVNVVGVDSIFTDFEITDTINSAYTFDWGGDVAPNVDGLPVAKYEFTAPGVYSFTLSVYEDVSGTTFSVTKTFEIVDRIIVPNVFTPNDDGVNDLFIVHSNGIDPVEIVIFTKSGTKVFETKSPIIVWDGRNSSGSLVSQGLYYYILTSKEPEPQKGFLYVIYDPKDIK